MDCGRKRRQDAASSPPKRGAEAVMEAWNPELGSSRDERFDVPLPWLLGHLAVTRAPDPLSNE
jgi:hypothetical protein